MKQKFMRYPDKTTINLVVRERTINSPSRIVPLFLAAALAVGLFCKFGVVDQLGRVARAQSELSALQTRAGELSAYTAGFTEVQDRFNRYSSDWMTDEEKALVDRLEVLALIDRYFFGSAAVQRFSMSGSALSVDISGVTLEGTSLLVSELESSPIVAGVAVYTANTGEAGGDGAAISMTVTLRQATEGGEG